MSDLEVLAPTIEPTEVTATPKRKIPSAIGPVLGFLGLLLFIALLIAGLSLAAVILGVWLCFAVLRFALRGRKRRIPRGRTRRR